MIWRVLFAPGPSCLSGPSDVIWLPLSGFCFVGLGCLLFLSFSLLLTHHAVGLVAVEWEGLWMGGVGGQGQVGSHFLGLGWPSFGATALV